MQQPQRASYVPDCQMLLFIYLLIVGLSHKTDNSFLSYNVPEL